MISGVTNIALMAKRAAEVRRIVHNAIGNDALLQQTLSDCLSRVVELETVQNVAWSAALLPG